MWIGSDQIRGRDGTGIAFLLLISLLCQVSSANVVVDSTSATERTQGKGEGVLASEIALPTSTATPRGTECKNLTAANDGIGEYENFFLFFNYTFISPCKIFYRFPVVSSKWSKLANSASYLAERSSHLPALPGYLCKPRLLPIGQCLLPSVAPSSKSTWGLHGVLYLRFTLLVGCAFLALWAYTIVCWLDAALWNILFVVIDFVHVCTLICRLRPVNFSKEIEEVSR